MLIFKIIATFWIFKLQLIHGESNFTFHIQSLLINQDLTYEESKLIFYTLNFLNRHLPAKGSLVISLPYKGHYSYDENELHITDAFLREANEVSKWKIIIADMVDKTITSTFPKVLKAQGYLIFTVPESDANEGIEDLVDQLIELSSPGVFQPWNAKALFLVVVSGEVNDSPEALAQQMLEELWNMYSVLKAFIIIPTHRKDSTSHPSFRVYTRLPFHSSILCMDFFDSELVEKWLWTIEEYPPNKSPIVQHSITKNFNGCPMRVTSALRNYRWKVTETGNKVIEYYSPEMTFFYKVAEGLNLTVINNIPKPTKTGSDYQKAVVKTVTDVVFGAADIALGSIPLDELPSTYADYAKSYHPLICSWYVPCKRYKSRVTTISRIFDANVWLVTVISLIAASVLMRLLAVPQTKVKVGETHCFRSVSNSIYFVWAIVLGGGIPQLPRYDKLRVFFFLFVCYSFAINTVYQTFFTSYLYDPGFLPRINDFDELLSSGIEFGMDPVYLFSVKQSLDVRHQEVIKRMVPCADRTYCFDRISITADFAYLDTHKLGLIYKAQNADRDIRICTLDDGGFSVNPSMYLKKDSPLIEPINRVITALQEAGILFKLEYDYILLFKLGEVDTTWFSNNATLHAEIETIEQDYVPLGLKHLQVAFYFVSIGSMLSLLVLITEVIYFYILRQVRK